jgi:PAS domain S-box-containing protein
MATAPPDPDTASLGDVLATEALRRRPARHPDHAAENRALAALARAAVDRPDDLPGRFAEVALDLCGAGSAGVSLLEAAPEGGTVFRWTALAGALAPHVGGCAPRDFSPCGLCLDRDEAVLVARPGRRFRYFEAVDPSIVEGLIVPLRAGGRAPVGTIWVVAHQEGRRFDAEDARVLGALGDFLALALEREGLLREREAAAAALAAARRRADDILESIDLGFYAVDRAWRLTYVNRHAERLWGEPREALLGRVLWDLFPGAGAEASEGHRLHQRAARERRPARGRFLCAALGAWVEASVHPGPDGLSVYFRDVGEAVRAEEHQRLLLAELAHRVKNTLAVVQGIANRSLAGGRTLEEGREALAERLRALSRAHTLLTATEWRGAALRAVLEGELGPYGERTALHGPALDLTPKAALTLSMVLHELATNAAKHGALSGPEGRVEVSWSLGGGADGASVRLRWRERDGPPVVAPLRHGFGRTLIEQGWRHELGGEVRVDFRPDGLVCELGAPAREVLTG